jgi:hypothetical protein
MYASVARLPREHLIELMHNLFVGVLLAIPIAAVNHGTKEAHWRELSRQS